MFFIIIIYMYMCIHARGLPKSDDDVEITINQDGDMIVSNNICNITLTQKIGGAVVNNFIPPDSKIPEFANIATTVITQLIIGFLVVRGITGQDIITP